MALSTPAINDPRPRIPSEESQISSPQFAVCNVGPAASGLQTAIGSRHSEEAVPPAFSREELLASKLRVAKVVPYQRASPPFISNLALSLCSGILLVFAFPEWNLWSLGWVGTAPLIMAVAREQSFWRSLCYGTVAGAVFYVGSSHWVTHSMHNYGGIALWLCYLLAAVAAVILGAFTGLSAALLALAIKRLGGWGILTAPILWVAGELARIMVTGMGWNALGYSQAFNPTVIQLARWGGVYAVSALLVMAAAALVFALVYLERPRGFVVLTAAGAVVGLAVLYGHTMVQAKPPARPVSVLIVQPNIPIDGPWDDPQFSDQMLLRHVALTEQELRRDSSNGPPGNIDLVIWPESPMNLEYDRDPALRRQLEEFARRNNVNLLFNSWAFGEGAPDTTVFNSAVIIGPSGDRTQRYDKIALMPFGEYVPARGWIPFMDRIPALVADVTPGTQVVLGDVAGARIGIAICFEITRPELARRMRREGASALVQISNESWFGRSAEPRQMLAHAVFRAVENDIELVRATNSGLSAEVSARGYVDGETPLFETATRRWALRTTDQAAADQSTFYTRHGDVFGVVCAALSVVLAAAALMPVKRTWQGNKG
jgi:apolipoprotein N-acyltransferase